MRRTKQLLLTEPPKSRVWISVISSQSFGVKPLLKGWTPEAQGVFTDNLNRARQELAATFERKSTGLRPISAGTDIFGALWQMKTLLDSVPAEKKEIWIFSDMLNETEAIPMPALLSHGTDEILSRVEASDLVVPLTCSPLSEQVQV